MGKEETREQGEERREQEERRAILRLFFFGNVLFIAVLTSAAQR